MSRFSPSYPRCDIHRYCSELNELRFWSDGVLQDFPKALVALQIADTTLYLVVGVVVYVYVGSTAVSPALGNTGTTLRRIAYGVSLPTIIISGVIGGHVCAKMIFVRV